MNPPSTSEIYVVSTPETQDDSFLRAFLRRSLPDKPLHYSTDIRQVPRGDGFIKPRVSLHVDHRDSIKALGLSPDLCCPDGSTGLLAVVRTSPNGGEIFAVIDADSAKPGQVAALVPYRLLSEESKTIVDFQFYRGTVSV